MNSNTKKTNCECFICGRSIYKTPSEIRKVKDGRLTCSIECYGKKQSIVNLERIEKKLGIKNFKKWLEYKYHSEKLTAREIAEIVYGKRTYAPNILGWMKKLRIETRERSEAVALQWVDNDKRRMKQSKLAKEKLSKGTIGRYNLIKIMQTKEYKNKSSKAKLGRKNPMWKEDLPEAERLDRAGKSANAKWVRTVKRRDKFTCQCCGITGVTMVAHHLNGYNWDVENRYNPENGITLCERCHIDFHRIYGNGDNTKEQFEEYISKIKSTKHKQLALF